MKVCSVCGVEKELDAFYRESRLRDGRSYVCKDCQRVIDKGRRKPLTPEQRRGARRRYMARHGERVRERERQKREAKRLARLPLYPVYVPAEPCPEPRVPYWPHVCERCGDVKMYADFPKHRGDVCLACRQERHRELLRERWRVYRDRHAAKRGVVIRVRERLSLEEREERDRERARQRRQDPMNRLNGAMACGMWRGLRKNKAGQHWEALVPYTLAELRAHLEKQFGEGMTWENYGEWHIDHIIPRAAFHFEHPLDLDFQRCWSLSNLRPLWGVENSAKGDRLERAFQPSLMLRLPAAT